MKTHKYLKVTKAMLRKDPFKACEDGIEEVAKFVRFPVMVSTDPEQNLVLADKLENSYVNLPVFMKTYTGQSGSYHTPTYPDCDMAQESAVYILAQQLAEKADHFLSLKGR